MKTKIFAIAAIIGLIFMFASEVQAMAIIGNDAEFQQCGRIIRHRRIIRRVVPRVVVSPVIIVRSDRYYRPNCPSPPIRRHWRYYR